MRPLLALVTLTIAAWVGCVPAWAEDGDVLTGTLKAIHDRGTILIGFRDHAVPFSFLNKGGQPVGFSLDICHEIAADVATTLGVDLVESDAPAWQKGVRIVYVPVAADQRLPKVIAGTVDLECGSTTANAERAKTVAFSPVFFLAGTKLMTSLTPKSGKPVTTYRDLAGGKVSVGAGTTNGVVLKRLAGSVSPPFTVVEQPGLDEAYNMLINGEVDAFASDDILLSGFVASHPELKQFAIVGDYLSYEPYAITLRRDDPAFADIVRGSFERMAEEGSMTSRYRRWFIDKLPTGETLDLPMSAQLSEMYRALGQPD